jgi:hypothetical protein
MERLIPYSPVPILVEYAGMILYRWGRVVVAGLRLLVHDRPHQAHDPQWIRPLARELSIVQYRSALRR